MYPLHAEHLVRVIQIEREEAARRHRHGAVERTPTRLRLSWPKPVGRLRLRVGATKVAAG